MFLARGMRQIGSIADWTPQELARMMLLIVTSSTIWLGISFLLAFFVAYLLALSWADYSYVQPASSIAYGIVAALGHFILGETISPLRWLGVLVICMGVFVVGRTPPLTTDE
jgi:drug/metabolite transporter (DMT)-like permease